MFAAGAGPFCQQRIKNCRGIVKKQQKSRRIPSMRCPLVCFFKADNFSGEYCQKIAMKWRWSWINMIANSLLSYLSSLYIYCFLKQLWCRCRLVSVCRLFWIWILFCVCVDAHWFGIWIYCWIWVGGLWLKCSVDVELFLVGIDLVCRLVYYKQRDYK